MHAYMHKPAHPQAHTLEHYIECDAVGQDYRVFIRN